MSSPTLETKTYEGEVGNSTHITCNQRGRVPTSAIAHLRGVRGEVPGEHRNRQGERWTEFVADIKANGVRDPIFITVDHGEQPKINEGNHRRDAAVEAGLPDVPVEIRYFGHAEQQTKVAGARGDLPEDMVIERGRDHVDGGGWFYEFVAVDGRGERIGYLTVSDEEYNRGEISSVLVESDYRRRGVASALLADARARLPFPVRHADNQSSGGKSWSQHVGSRSWVQVPMQGGLTVTSEVKTSLPSWRDRGVRPTAEAIIAPDVSREGRRYEVTLYGEPAGRRSSLAEAKALVEDVYGPLDWEQVEGDTDPHYDRVHGWTTQFNDASVFYLVRRLPRLSATAAGVDVQVLLGRTPGGLKRELKPLIEEAAEQGWTDTYFGIIDWPINKGSNGLAVARKGGKIVGAFSFDVRRQNKECTLTGVRTTEQGVGVGFAILAAIAKSLPGPGYMMDVYNVINSARSWYLQMGADFVEWASSGKWSPEKVAMLAQGRRPPPGHDTTKEESAAEGRDLTAHELSQDGWSRERIQTALDQNYPHVKHVPIKWDPEHRTAAFSAQEHAVYDAEDRAWMGTGNEPARDPVRRAQQVVGREVVVMQADLMDGGERGAVAGWMYGQPSIYYAEVLTEQMFLHELAHLVVEKGGVDHGHDQVWADALGTLIARYNGPQNAEAWTREYASLKVGRRTAIDLLAVDIIGPVLGQYQAVATWQGMATVGSADFARWGIEQIKADPGPRQREVLDRLRKAVDVFAVQQWGPGEWTDRGWEPRAEVPYSHLPSWLREADPAHAFGAVESRHGPDPDDRGPCAKRGPSSTARAGGRGGSPLARGGAGDRPGDRPREIELSRSAQKDLRRIARSDRRLYLKVQQTLEALEAGTISRVDAMSGPLASVLHVRVDGQFRVYFLDGDPAYVVGITAHDEGEIRRRIGAGSITYHVGDGDFIGQVEFYARQGQKVVGGMVAHPRWGVEWIFVLPTHRRRGIAAGLYRFATEHFGEPIRFGSDDYSDSGAAWASQMSGKDIPSTWGTEPDWSGRLREMERQHTGSLHTADMSAREIYSRTDRIRDHCKKISIPEATALLRKVLVEAHFPQGDQAECEQSIRPNSSNVLWYFDTDPPTPGVGLNARSQTDLTLLHEAAHLVRMGRYLGAPPMSGGTADSTHDARWFGIWTDLVHRYAAWATRYEFDRTFGLVDDPEWEKLAPLKMRAAAVLGGQRGSLPEGIEWAHGPETGTKWGYRLSATIDGEVAGWMEWVTGGPRAVGTILNVWVQPEYQRRGLATEMLRRAREIDPRVQHATTLTDVGKAWAQTTGSLEQRTAIPFMHLVSEEPIDTAPMESEFGWFEDKASFNWIHPLIATGGALRYEGDIRILQRRGVTVIVSGRNDFDDKKLTRGHQYGIKFAVLPSPDDGRPKPTSWFKQAIDACLPALRSGHRVYLHCHAGMNRGPSLAYAVLRAYTRWDHKRAFDAIKSARDVALVGYAGDADRALVELGYARKRADTKDLPEFHSLTGAKRGDLTLMGDGRRNIFGPDYAGMPGGANRPYAATAIGKNGRIYYLVFEISDQVRAYDDKGVVCGALSWWDWQGRKQIYKVHVSAAHRRQGVASAMLALARIREPSLGHADSGLLSDDAKGWQQAYAKIGSGRVRVSTDIPLAYGQTVTHRLSLHGAPSPVMAEHKKKIEQAKVDWKAENPSKRPPAVKQRTWQRSPAGYAYFNPYAVDKTQNILEPAPADLIGFVDVGVDRGRMEHVSIAYLAVRPDHRGKGLARELIQAVYDQWPNATVHWGKLMQAEMGHLYEWFREHHPEQTGSASNHYSSLRTAAGEEFRAQKLRDQIAKDPRWKDLAAKLLDVAGEEVLATEEPDMARLLSIRARTWPGAGSILRKGDNNGCHANSAALWEADGYSIATGYAANDDDGMWRQHSWAINPAGKVVETTADRDHYYGFVLTESEAKRFREANPDRYGSNPYLAIQAKASAWIRHTGARFERMYHIAPTRERDSIMREGLRFDPEWARSSPTIRQLVWLFGSEADAETKMDKSWGASRGLNDLWEVDISGLEIEPDPDAGWSDLKTWVVEGPVPTSRLRLVRANTGRKTGAEGDLPPDLRYEPQPPSGEVRAIWVSTADGTGVGMISWREDTGEIAWVQVYEGWQRKGIATEMLRRARQINPKVHHSTEQNAAAKAWTKAVASLTGKPANAYTAAMPPRTLWHVTDKRDFTPDPGYKPRGAPNDMDADPRLDAALYLTQNPELWKMLWLPHASYAAEIDVSKAKVHEITVSKDREQWLVEPGDFDKIKVLRVVPIAQAISQAKRAGHGVALLAPDAVPGASRYDDPNKPFHVIDHRRWGSTDALCGATCNTSNEYSLHWATAEHVLHGHPIPVCADCKKVLGRNLKRGSRKAAKKVAAEPLAMFGKGVCDTCNRTGLRLVGHSANLVPRHKPAPESQWPDPLPWSEINGVRHTHSPLGSDGYCTGSFSIPQGQLKGSHPMTHMMH